MEKTQVISQKKIGFLDLKQQFAQVKDEVFEAFEKVCANTAFSGGPFVAEFEEHFAPYCEAKNAIAVNNGTSSLHLAMLALGIGAGDEVIVPANTFIATAWGPTYVGATPVFVDCDPKTWQIDPSKIEEKITSRTKAIIGVHLYGQPFDVDAVAAIAKKHDLFLVEDAAQAQGAKYKGTRVGGLAEMACFSFYPGKNLGACGEGGAVTTNSDKYDTHIRRLRNHGCDKRYYHDEVGFNMRMGGLEGACLNIKLKYLTDWNNKRKEIASRYQKEITNPAIQMQAQPDFADSVYHLFVITTEDRDGLMKYMNEHNVFPGMHYPVPCHLQKAYSNLRYREGDFPHSEYLASHCLSLPIYAELPNEDVDYIINLLNDYQSV